MNPTLLLQRLNSLLAGNTPVASTIADVLHVLARSKADYSLFGGFLRDLHLFGEREHFRDVDIVVQGLDSIQLSSVFSPYNPSLNSLGGLKFHRNGTSFDVWPIEITWAYKQFGLTPSFDTLPLTTFLNMEAITAVTYRDGQHAVVESGYFDGVARMTIDLNFIPNPNPPAAIMKTLILGGRLGFGLSSRLLQYISQNRESDLQNRIMHEHNRHYSDSRLTPHLVRYWIRLIALAASRSCDGFVLPLPTPKQTLKLERDIVLQMAVDRRRCLASLSGTSE